MNHRNPTSTTTTTTDALEAKLQGVESSLRQERETARRQQQLAAERCRLLQQEFDSMSKTVQGLQTKWTQLQDEVSTSSPALQKLRTIVDKLTQEVNFQHAQLVQKRNKTKETQEATVALDRQQRNKMQQLRSVIQNQRRRSSIVSNENKEPLSNGGQDSNNGDQENAKLMTSDDTASTDFWKEMLENNQADGNAGLVVVGPGSLPRLMHTKAERLDEMATRMEQSETAALQRIVAGYQKHLQLVVASASASGDGTTTSLDSHAPPATAMMEEDNSNSNGSHHLAVQEDDDDASSSVPIVATTGATE